MRARPVLIAAACLLWGAGIVAGFAAAERYTGTPGEAASTADAWPAATTLERDPARPTLLVFVHPLCPCTRATIEELSQLLSHCGDRLSATVVFVTAPALGTDWQQGGMWESVAALPGVRAVVDDGGAQARCFGARTSGQAELFGADGRRLFAGGLTAGRGHAGDNAGLAAIQEHVLQGRGPASTPVFGCALPGAEKP